MTFLEYLSRFAAVRLLSWHAGVEQFSTSAMIAIGRVRLELEGRAQPLKPKLAAEIARTRRALVEHMLHESAACCDETTFDFVAAARAA